MSWLFTSDGQDIGASVSASVLPMNIQGLFPLGLTGLISLQSKGLSRVFYSTTVQKHQFFGTQPLLWSSSHISPSVVTKNSLYAKVFLTLPSPIKWLWPRTQCRQQRVTFRADPVSNNLLLKPENVRHMSLFKNNLKNFF